MSIKWENLKPGIFNKIKEVEMFGNYRLCISLLDFSRKESSIDAA